MGSPIATVTVSAFLSKGPQQQRQCVSALLSKGPPTATVKLEKWGRCQLAIPQLVASFAFRAFRVFKAVHHEYPLAFSVMSNMP